MPVRTERMPYTEEQIDRLVELYLLARTTRRQDPIGSPKRAAGDEFTATIARIRKEPEAHGEKPYTFYELATPLMIPGKNGKLRPMDQLVLRRYLGRRGYVTHPESQDPYKANDPDYTPPAPNLRTEEHFSCKHWVDTEGNEVEVEDGEDGNELGYREVFCERTEANTYIHRFTRKVKSTGETRRYEIDICRRHSLKASAKYQQKRKKNGNRKTNGKAKVIKK